MRLFQRTLNWVEDRTGLVSITRSIMQHPVPRDARWWYVFGSATLLCFIIQVITGIVLGAMYVPSPDQAYQSLQFITETAFVGRFVRGLHSWGATAMIILIGIHLAQVFVFAAYKFPREVNWISGALLLAVTLSMAFTGQILRWDDNGVWTTVVLVNMVGRVPLIGAAIARFLLAGDVVSGSTLSHFFTYHVFLIPALIFGLIGLHLFLVIRNGISETPRHGQPVDPRTYRARYEALLKREGVPFWPESIWRDAIFALVVFIVLVLLAALVGPPELTNPPSPADVSANPRPDWYFIWLFAALALLPPGVEFGSLIGGSVIFFVVLILLPLLANKGERSWKARPWSVGIVGLAIAMVGALTVKGLQAPWSPDFAAQPLPPQVVGTTSGPIAQGAALFASKGCIYCHAIAGDGGHRGPDLTDVGDRLSADQITWRIANGGNNMPPFAETLRQDELHELVAFLSSRKEMPSTAGQAQPGANGAAIEAKP
jgi:ubiquinol-cytochrome c reductase cytochrome b subunit